MSKVAPAKNLHVSKEVEETIRKIDAFIDKHNLGGFWVFPHLKTFKRIHNAGIPEMIKYVQKDLDKYAGKEIAHIKLCSNLDAIKDKKEYILYLGVTLSKIPKDGDFNKIENHINKIAINYYDEDILKGKFGIAVIKYLLELVKNKKNKTSPLGIKFKNFIEKLKKNDVDTKPLLY